MLDKEYCDYAISEMETCDKFIPLFYGKQVYNYDFYWIGIHEENDLKHLYFPIIDSLLSAKDKYLEKIDIHPIPGPKRNIKEVDYFIEFGDKIRIQHHRKGGFTPRHIDNSISQNPPKQKIPYHPYERFLEAGNANISAVLYLNDNYKGGEFYILDKEYYAEKGSIIVFPSGFMYPHGVRKVTEGERWSISIFLR